MNILSKQFPLQKTTNKDNSWKQKCVDVLIEQSANSALNSDQLFLQKCYDYYHGLTHESDFREVLKPFGEDVDVDYGQIKNYNIIKPMVDVFVGEKVKRPIPKQVIVTNPDVESEKEKELYNSYTKLLYEMFMGEISGNQKKVDIEEWKQQFEEDYQDYRAIAGQHAISYLDKKMHLTYRFMQGFKDFVISGRSTTLKEILYDDVVYEILDPRNVDYDRDPSIDFIEDGQWAIVRSHMSYSKIVEKYGKELQYKYGEKILDELQENTELYGQSVMGRERFFERDFNNLIEIHRVYWKSFKKVGIVRGIDPATGNYYEDEVAHPFTPNDNETVEWEWENEVWQGVRIGPEKSGYYVNIDRVPVQRNEINNGSACKLPINGVTYNNRAIEPTSFVFTGISFQIIYDTYMRRLEMAFAKAKDMVALIDDKLIPDDMSPEQWLRWVDKTGIAFVSADKEHARFSAQIQQVLDLSVKSAQQYMAMLNMILQSWERLSGVTPQRAGQVGPYAGKGATERSVIQSSHITEEMFALFEWFEETEMQGLLDISKGAWIDGKKLIYVDQDKRQAMYDLDGIQHLESDYGVFVSGDDADRETLENIRQLSQAMVQNGSRPSTVLEMMRSKNISQLSEKLKKEERRAEENQKKMQQQEEKLEQMKAQLEDKKMKNLVMIKQLDNQGKADVAMISATKENDEFEKEKLDKEISLKREELAEEKRSNMAKEAIERRRNNSK